MQKSAYMILFGLLILNRAPADPPADFPRFLVPGHEREMAAIRELFWLHYQPARPLATLWDEWLPNATLWPARGSDRELASMRQQWARALGSRGIDAEGYVHTHQHDGLGHARGWPFPLWTQAGGVGWHFRGTGIPGYDAPQATPDDWKLKGAVSRGVDERGWVIDLISDGATLETPLFAMEAGKAPFLRLNWWPGKLSGARCFVEWTTTESPEYTPSRRAYFDGRTDGESAERSERHRSREVRTMIPVHRLAGWKGTITRLRIGFENAGSETLVVKSLHTASDTRHSVNNLNFIRGCHDYFLWARDVDFLRTQLPRVRKAMRFVEREFQIRQKSCIYCTWVGHEGRSGVRWVDGQKQVILGEGVGSNYWDLLPFGGEDALATVYLYDALLDLAELEEFVADKPEWKTPEHDDAYASKDLKQLAADIREYAGRRFWNERTGRFGTVDLDGVLHDYGFTFLNNEAVYFGLATSEQSRSIHDWLSGRRVVAGDDSVGADIYHWRFGPRSTTLRNVDYYFWAWSMAETIPFGFQVQDGGAVLGWSYYDLMARLKTAGPDDAAVRLAEIAAWFRDTQEAGGYRPYYAQDPNRGSLQGGGSAGGLGLDHEFYESVLVPQVMLYGFLGFRPTFEGFAIAPQLPTDWPSLTVTRIHLHDWVLDVTATRDGAVSVAGAGPAQTIEMKAGEGVTLRAASGVSVKAVDATPLRN